MKYRISKYVTIEMCYRYSDTCQAHLEEWFIFMKDITFSNRLITQLNWQLVQLERATTLGDRLFDKVKPFQNDPASVEQICDQCWGSQCLK